MQKKCELQLHHLYRIFCCIIFFSWNLFENPIKFQTKSSSFAFFSPTNCLKIKVILTLTSASKLNDGQRPKRSILSMISSSSEFLFCVWLWLGQFHWMFSGFAHFVICFWERTFFSFKKKIIFFVQVLI